MINCKKIITASLITTSICGYTAEESTPNIIYFLCDDLGIGELSCYGQSHINTPNIDKLAENGMLFSNFYSSSSVSAPSRCSLLTGQHTGHTYIRGNKEIKNNGQEPIPSDTNTIAKVLKKSGYVNACIGKWGLGGINTDGNPLKQGFDYFYGYNCQRHAHSYYPQYLYENNNIVQINKKDIYGHERFSKIKNKFDEKNYKKYIGENYSPDEMTKKMISFIDENANNKFFLYYATPLPHVSLQAPINKINKNKYINEKPYLGDNGYLPCRYPKATYDAMITKIDEDLGVIIEALKKNNILDNTIIFFASDNGPTYNGGTSSSFFNSNLGKRGLKGSVFEGGIKVPLIVSWNKKIKKSTTDFTSAGWDIFPTICELVKINIPNDIDGISILPTLLNNGKKQKEHDYLYWENHEKKNVVQAIRVKDYKLVKNYFPQENYLFNLKNDSNEQNNLYQKEPEKALELENLIKKVRTPSKAFPLLDKIIF